MLPTSNYSESERVLLLAPYGRDGALIQKELESAGFSAVVCQSIHELCCLLKAGAGAALLADEALSSPSIERLKEQLSNQPAWSDFPLLVMTSGGAATEGSRYRLRLIEPLGNITLLERPLRPATLVSAVQAALRARRRQYEVCNLLGALADSNDELKHANRDLTRVNRELEEFAYVASHDLQEPLRTVNIYTHLILKQLALEEDPALNEYRRFVHQGVSRMEALIHDLLTFSRTIQGDDAQAGVADLTRSLNEALSILEQRIRDSRAVVIAGYLPEVQGDTTQLAHVFQNLISNSIKYRKACESPQIHISAETKEGQCEVAVSDNGIGFDQQYAERIFGLFKRLHKDAYPGTGLGLAICRRIVERYGGRIWARSQAGQGSTFYFSLPCLDA
jgi:signal transduction histidine kinase